MNNLKFAYNLGLSNDFNNGTISADIYYKKLQANKGLQANLKSLNTQISLTKAYNASNIITVESYILALEAVSLSLLRRNSQAYKKDLSKINGYGNYLNEIRQIIYEDQNTDKGFIGTLLYYQNKEGSTLSILDNIEKCLLNFWNKLGIDPYLSPRERWHKVLTDLDLPLSQNYYYDLEIQIKETITVEANVKLKFESLLLDFSDITDLHKKIICLEIEESIFLFLEWLFQNNYIELDIVSIKNRLINFNLVGGMPLLLLAFIVESLVLSARDLSYLDLSIRSLELSKFIESNDYTTICHKIAIYLSLGYDASELLKYSFEENELFREALINDLGKFIKEEIKEKEEYRLDG